MITSVTRRMHNVRSWQRTGAALAVMCMLPGCVSHQQVAPGEMLTVLGPVVRDNRTPMEAVLACFADRIVTGTSTPLVIAVGDIKDYTGKYNINEGNAITQGGALMVYSALGKLHGAVRSAERFDPQIAERELGYTDRRQLGDGEIHDLADAKGQQKVPWLPYYGGTIVRSDYYIVGGITELNYDIGSRGGEVGVNQIGVKARVYNESIGIDLRIVDTRTLMVVKTISLTKQLTGYEVGVNVFRFFNSNLFDVNVGAKGQEPLQLGVRTALEEGVMRLVGGVTHIDPEPCMPLRIGGIIPSQSADTLRQVERPGSKAGLAAGSPRPLGAVAVNTASTLGAGRSTTALQLTFEFGAAALSGAALDQMDRIVGLAAKGPVQLLLTARDTEVFDSGKRDGLTDQRIAAVVSALSSRGIASGAIATTWRPAASDTTIHRDGPGLQELAKLTIGG